MTNTKDIQWKRISVEAAAIVVSILLAFAIDRWWEHRQYREDERAILTSLLQGFEVIQNIHEGQMRHYVALRNSALHLVDTGRGVRNDATDDDIDRMLEDLWWAFTPSIWTVGDLDSMIASGEITLISNGELRLELGRWPIKLRGLRDFVGRDLEFHRDQFMPYYLANTSLPQLAMAADFAPGNPELPYNWGHDFNIEEKISHRELLSRLEFQNLLVQRAGNVNDILLYGFGDPRLVTGDAVARIVNLIERELVKFGDN